MRWKRRRGLEMPSSHDRKMTTALRHSIHGQSKDYTIHLSVALQIPVPVVEKAKELHETMLKHPLWDNRRTPHGLLVDCLYITANRNGHKITVKKMVEVSKKVLEISTQPRPREWTDAYSFVVEEVLG